MGRSKFPGKPSKHVNRKRINVLPPTSEGIIESSGSLTVENVTENKQNEKEAEEVSESENAKRVNKVSLTRRLSRKMQSSKALISNNSSKRGLISKLCNKNVKLSVKNRNISRKSVHSYSPMKTFRTKASNNLVGKFVLPTRSVHSSRVIKPNKRFINVDLSENITLKKRVLNKRLKSDSGQNKSESVSESPQSFSNGRVVLRQARLKLHTQTPKGSEGPFSNSSTKGSPPGTVTCGVCGAVRFYRFVKQARKFNIYSCESCRKFISKMIKRQSCGKNVSSATLVCHKGQGMCHVPPIVRSQQMKLIRCAYRSRCPACWLKMCLRSFQMPLSLKNSLIQLLPKNMQGSDVMFNNSLPLLWQVSVPKIDNQVVKSESEVNHRPVRFKNPKPVIKTNPVTDIKRQKIDLKGPRVKHVCRSASIVLGQPLAIFPEPEKEKEKKKEDKKIIDKSKTESETESDNDKLVRVPLMNETRKERSHRVPSSAPSPVSSVSSTMTSSTLFEKLEFEKKPILDPQNTISIDFWEHSDLEDINQNGFCLISSQQFPMPAICFLCGSAGREALLHCSLCCEPYHPFCIERNPVNNRQLWFCPKCTTCQSCNQLDRKKSKCQKCFKSFHPECLNTEWAGKDRPLICSKCLTCKDCGDTKTTKFFGNLALCVSCFKLRKKGTCPVCLVPFKEECDEKIMECTKCKKWLHTECENLSEEYYHILSYLPDSVKYLCCLCCKNSSPYWCKAVEAELKFSFNQVLRLLSGDKTARSILKNKKFDSDNQESDELSMKPQSTVLDIKRKLNEYISIRDFNKEVELVLSHNNSEELLSIYRRIFKSIFPWFVPSQLEEDPVTKNNIKQRFFNNIDEVHEQIECVSIDSRYCSLCKSIGDGLSHLESRLLYCGQNEWVHINCALWSSEVYEEIDGSLQNVHTALTRARVTRCSYCKQKGATVGCAYKSCCEIYHFLCARTAKCHFMKDKTVFCCNHDLPKPSNVIITPTDFNIRRSVYVEVADYKKGFSQIDKVNVMVGSLSVTNLGKINPNLSDTVEAIIPTGYSCSRLFWSTVEPWKLVSYKISTSVLNANVNSLQVDKSFTVDHSLPKSVVDRKLKDIFLWHKDLDKKKVDLMEFDDEEEPQNGADLLSPEITDAIFEELPHELLDGISVQDIFPKLMSYEDFITMDTKSDNVDNNDLKKSEELDVDDFDAKNKRCNLTLSCKLDNSFSPVLKKRKVSNRDSNVFFQILQVDGNFDDSSSECGSPVGNTATVWQTDLSEEPVTCERCQCTYRTQASYKRHLDSCEMICSSESDSEQNQEQEVDPPQIHIPETTITQPVVITSYEYQNEIHTSVLNTQTFVAAKTSEVVTMPQTEVMLQKEICVPVNEQIHPVGDDVYTVSPQTIPDNQFCLNPVSLCVNQPLIQPNINSNPIINQTISINQSTVQPQLDFQPSVTIQSLPYSNMAPPIINVTPPNQIINFGNRWVKPDLSPKSKVKRRLAVKRDDDVLLQNQSVIVQQLPSNNFIPNFVDTLQSAGQNVQYVLAPPQPLVQIQDNNLISLLPGIQPTMIIQQPNNLIVDSNGLSWTPQPQPVYYGFETIVQNTVMQSQQFLPSTVPGVLTANSSYSTTTQVFQTSKLEPVLDVGANSFVLVNTGLVNSSPLEVPQVNVVNEMKYSPVKTNQVNNSITLPTAPFVPEQGIPTNIVTPTPKPITNQSRPMSRVLPMQTVKETKEPKIKPAIERKEVRITKTEDFDKKVAYRTEIDFEKEIKMTAQKQEKVEEVQKVSFAKESTYKINSTFSRNSPVQIAPLKPIKSLNPPKPLAPLAEKQNIEKKLAIEPKHVATTQEKKEIENLPSILYTIETKDGFKYSSTSIADLWAKVFEAVQSARAAHNMPLLPSDSSSIVSSLQILGLKTSGLKYLIEQLPGATKCTKYRPSFNFPSKFIELEEDLIGHSSGCARCAPHIKRNEPYDMFGWLASKHRKPEHSLLVSDLVPRRGSVNNLPMAMRFRQLKLTSKYSVGVYRSKIHRRGLFCLRDFEAGEMVIEYSGEVIRSILTDKREKFYNSKGIGCYMFRIDDNLVVDATMTGNAARFINHSCDPNCYSKVVEILGHKHIIIFALRRIICGEELTYDYKFPIEEDKIPCTCGTRRCRKFLN